VDGHLIIDEARSLQPAARALLLRILVSPSTDRARVIAQLHAQASTRDLAELLIDLEADEALRRKVVAALRATSWVRGPG
jgi:hypothetical protein